MNDEPVNDLVFNFEERTGDSSYVWARQDIDRFKLNRQARWLFKIDVEWRMPVWPQWMLGAQLADSRLAAKIQTQRNFMTEATIVWGLRCSAKCQRTPNFAVSRYQSHAAAVMSRPKAVRAGVVPPGTG